MRDLSSDGVFRCTLWKVDDLCNVALPLWIQSPNWKRLCEHCLLYSSLCWTLLMTSCKTVQLFSNAVLLHSRYLSPGRESTGVTNIAIILLLYPGYRGVMQQIHVISFTCVFQIKGSVQLDLLPPAPEHLTCITAGWALACGHRPNRYYSV